MRGIGPSHDIISPIYFSRLMVTRMYTKDACVCRHRARWLNALTLSSSNLAAALRGKAPFANTSDHTVRSPRAVYNAQPFVTPQD